MAFVSIVELTVRFTFLQSRHFLHFFMLSVFLSICISVTNAS